MRKLLFTMIIIGVVLASGCTMGGLDFLNPGGGTVKQVVEENDIIKVQNMQLIGEEPILDKTKFTLYFEIQNMHDKRDVKSVSAYLTNWEPCKVESIDNNKNIQIVGGKYTIFEGTKISAGGVEAVEIEFTAITPTKELPGKCNIQYLIEYTFDAKTSFSGIGVIDSDYLRELSRAGKKPEASPLINVGIGPLKIMFQTDVPMPIREGEDIPVTMWIENRGAEVFGDIAESNVVVKVPEEFWDTDKGTKCDRFEVAQCGGTPKQCEEFGRSYCNRNANNIDGKENGCCYRMIKERNTCNWDAQATTITTSEGETRSVKLCHGEVPPCYTITNQIYCLVLGGAVYGCIPQTDGVKETIGDKNLLYLINNQRIPMIRGKSTQLRFTFVSPSDVDYEKEYFILADMEYKYKIRGEKKVQTKPRG